jgi:DNA-directed RNA polymerase subunit RPC12/RpoP
MTTELTPGSPPAGKKFPCVQCGARLDYDPGARSLKCPYCGHVEEINPEKATVQEHDFEAYLRKQSGESTVAGRSSQVKCNTCGAVVLLEDKVAADRCPYCASFIENKPEAAKTMVPPECILPFRVESRQAIEAYNDWLKGLWFAPNSLKDFANLGKLNGVYVPFWTFDSMTYTFYRGERGDDYQETETYTDTETYFENGETKTRNVTKTRTVTRTRWTSVSGEVNHFFDDVPVCASEGVPENYAASLTPKELKGVEPFRSEYLSGFTTERYAIGPKEGFDKAKQIMDAQIRQLCHRAIGGDHQRLHSVNTQHVGVTFKHLLLPIWLASYRYQDKSYRVMVNGQTGYVMGDRPYSWVKIVVLVLVILVAILAIMLAMGVCGGGAAWFGGQSRRAEAPAFDLPAASASEWSAAGEVFKGGDHALVSLSRGVGSVGGRGGDVCGRVEGGGGEGRHHAEGADVAGRLRRPQETRRRHAA